MNQVESDAIIFGAPSIGDEELREVDAVLRSGWLGTGPRVAAFEAQFAQFKALEAAQVAAVNSCTAALHVSMVAAGLERGAEVITTPLTFCATVNAIIHAGLRPVLADVDPISQCISVEAIEAAITSRTQAIIPVHFAGRMCDMPAIMALARKHNLKVIEDCAHAVEADLHDKPAGTFGDFGCFSFYVTKNVTTGEGGMVVGQNQDEINRVRVLALHGLDKDAWHRFGDKGYKHYKVVEAGFKYNMTDIQAAIGIHQLARVKQNWKRRKIIWEQYQNAFSDLEIVTPAEFLPNQTHGLHLYTIRITPAATLLSRDDFLEKMNAVRVGCGVHYVSVAEHPFYQDSFGWKPENYRHSTQIGRETVSLPLSAALTDAQVERVIRSVRDALCGDGRNKK
ncbi:MAG: DegT/DnrJ/EryC1/StrS family aminotransferase [Xanthomonadales bacterium]|nr:DegT/DnrJ/EryC1/StrS family aminotransferase [Xanthomonadales bacterium]